MVHYAQSDCGHTAVGIAPGGYEIALANDFFTYPSIIATGRSNLSFGQKFVLLENRL